MTALSTYIKECRPEFEEWLADLVQIPTVSADPARRKDMDRAASLACEVLRCCGASAKIHKTQGNPVVVGRFTSPRARRTLTIYNHLDVQPADEPEWRRDPFVFVKEGDKYFGRGSTDDKGPALTALLAARYAAESGVPLNIQFIWELEEEIGSPHFEGFLRSQADSLQCNSVLVIDSIWISKSKPSICYGIRGNVTGSMLLETAAIPVHSGITGGVARNPIAELAEVISKCYDAKTGHVLIPGFYQNVRKASSKERRIFETCGFDLQSWSRAYHLKKIRVKGRSEALARIWCRPTFEVHGIAGGYTGPGIKTAIPPRAELKFSCRLVADQDPEEMARLVERYVAKINPDVSVVIHSKLHPYLEDFSGPMASAAYRAMEAGFSRTPVFVRSGGSDGAIISLHKHFNAPVIMIGLSLPEHGYHAPNEYFDWGQAAGGIKTLVRYFEEISR